jgi:hypothetical protein
VRMASTGPAQPNVPLRARNGLLGACTHSRACWAFGCAFNAPGSLGITRPPSAGEGFPDTAPSTLHVSFPRRGSYSKSAALSN